MASEENSVLCDDGSGGGPSSPGGCDKLGCCTEGLCAQTQPEGPFTTDVLNELSVHSESPGACESPRKRELTSVSAAISVVPETQETPWRRSVTQSTKKKRDERALSGLRGRSRKPMELRGLDPQHEGPWA